LGINDRKRKVMSQKKRGMSHRISNRVSEKIKKEMSMSNNKSMTDEK
jgi:hypothetical protein